MDLTLRRSRGKGGKLPVPVPQTPLPEEDQEHPRGAQPELDDASASTLALARTERAEEDARPSPDGEAGPSEGVRVNSGGIPEPSSETQLELTHAPRGQPDTAVVLRTGVRASNADQGAMDRMTTLEGPRPNPFWSPEVQENFVVEQSRPGFLPLPDDSGPWETAQTLPVSFGPPWLPSQSFENEADREFWEGEEEEAGTDDEMVPDANPRSESDAEHKIQGLQRVLDQMKDVMSAVVKQNVKFAARLKELGRRRKNASAGDGHRSARICLCF